MIPHPLTLLLCWMLGAGASRAIGLVIQFVLEILVEFNRWGWLYGAAFDWSTRGVDCVGYLVGGLACGFVMRLLGEPSWPKAAFWALTGAVLAIWVPYLGAVSVRLAARAMLVSWPTTLCTALGCVAGAWLCERWSHRHEVQGAESFLRGWMFWERGGGA